MPLLLCLPRLHGRLLVSIQQGEGGSARGRGSTPVASRNPASLREPCFAQSVSYVSWRTEPCLCAPAHTHSTVPVMTLVPHAPNPIRRDTHTFMSSLMRADRSGAAEQPTDTCSCRDTWRETAAPGPAPVSTHDVARGRAAVSCAGQALMLSPEVICCCNGGLTAAGVHMHARTHTERHTQREGRLSLASFPHRTQQGQL